MLSNQKAGAADGTFSDIDEACVLPVETEDSAPRKSEITSILLQSESTPTPPFRFALFEIFQRFDLDLDGSLNSLELAAYHETAVGETLDSAACRWYRAHCGLSDAGALSQTRFVDMYVYLAAVAPAAVWTALRALGYDASLRLQEARRPCCC
jgi:hypothetical protein